MGKLHITWLGQSGFWIHTSQTTIACDLYLSDYCNKCSKLDHTRKMPIPVLPQSLKPVDHYLITHAHIDHFDPETVRPILDTNLQTMFYCPPDCLRVVDEFFEADKSRFILLTSGKEYPLTDGIRFIPLPAAHEQLSKDDAGEYTTMSYMLIFDHLKKAVLLAGDTIPFDNQADLINEVVPQDFELTLVLPVNGRDAKRAALGFKGNMTLDEAIELYHKTNAIRLIPCHFGMFELNDLPSVPEKTDFTSKQCKAVIPSPYVTIEL